MDNMLPKILIASGVFVVLVIIFIFMGVALFSNTVLKQAMAQEPSAPAVISQPIEEKNAPITINKIIGSPVVYKDLPVTVEGKIVGWVTKNAVIVSEVGEKNNKNRMLIIRNQNFGLSSEIPASDVAIGETVNISVTGTAGILNIGVGDTSYGDEYSVRELRKWNKKPVIFASAVDQK